MPLYQLWCKNCHEPYEVTMTLAVCDEFDKGKVKKKCPECKKPMKKIICPPKLILIDNGNDNPGTYNPTSRYK